MQIYRLKILQEDSCKEIVDKVLSLWSEFYTGAYGLFYTLGNALYQNKDINIYYQKAKCYNQLLFEEFHLLYDEVLTSMSNFLKSDVGFFVHTSLPGFHIFNIGDFGNYNGGGRHFDLSYQRIFNSRSIKFDIPHYSFTLSLQLPQSPAGLNLWNIYYPNLLTASESLNQEEQAEKQVSYFIPYNVGEMVIFNGYYLHQIAPVSPIYKGDRRITLQGHCLYMNNQWGIYF